MTTTKITTYQIQDKESGNAIITFNCYQDALTELKIYEKHDKHDGIYVPDFYEIVEITN